MSDESWCLPEKKPHVISSERLCEEKNARRITALNKGAYGSFEI